MQALLGYQHWTGRRLLVVRKSLQSTNQVGVRAGVCHGVAVVRRVAELREVGYPHSVMAVEPVLSHLVYPAAPLQRRRGKARRQGGKEARRHGKA